MSEEHTDQPTRPRVLTQTDLQACWTSLMQPLGFSYARLYLMLIPPDGRCDGSLTEIAELPDAPDPLATDSLLRMCGDLIGSLLPDGSRVAFLYARPGRAGLAVSDRAWGRALVSSAGRTGVSLWPVHVANDDELRVLAPDDLEQPA